VRDDGAPVSGNATLPQRAPRRTSLSPVKCVIQRSVNHHRNMLYLTRR